MSARNCSRPSTRQWDMPFPRGGAVTQSGSEDNRFPDDAVEIDEDLADVSRALRLMAEVGLSARTRETRGTARTLAGSVRSYEIHYT
jgi:hypothetical protein